MRRILIALFAIVSACACASCTHQAAAPTAGTKAPVKVGFITSSIGGFWLYAKAGVMEACKDFNVDCDFQMPMEPNATQQKAIMEDMLSKGVSGITISPMDPENEIEMLNDAASKVNLICEDSDAPTSKRICYIGTNNYEAGRKAGTKLLSVLPHGGKVMIFVGSLDAGNAQERIRGVRDAVKGSQVQILGVLTDNLDRAKARANAEDTLTRHRDLAGMVGIWGPNGPACAEAVKAAGKVGIVKIVSFDAEDAALQGVKDGVIEATVAQNPYGMGYDAVRVLAALARHEDPHLPKSKYIDTGVTVVTKSNVDPFWANLRKLRRTVSPAAGM